MRCILSYLLLVLILFVEQDGCRSMLTAKVATFPINRKSSQLIFHQNAQTALQAKESMTTDIDKTLETNSVEKSVLPRWFLPFTTASLGGFMYGMDIGTSSSVVRILGEGLSEFGELDALKIGLVASGSLFGAIISSATITFLGDKNIGRKVELQTAALFFILGTIVQSIGSTFEIEILGRVLYGLGIGAGMHVAPLFIGETSPDKLRGKLISFKEAAIVLGIVFGYLLGAFFSADNNWHAVFAGALPFELLMLVGAVLVPESPRWLALRGRKEEAEQALQQIQTISASDAKDKVQEMVDLSNKESSLFLANNNVDREKVTDETSALGKLNEIFSSKYNRRALLIGMGLVLFQQLSGQPSVLYFANRIFEQSHLGFQAAVGVGLFKLLMTTVSAYLVESPRFGRRSLLLLGNSGVLVSLLLLAYIYGPGGELLDNVVGASSNAAAEGWAALSASQLAIIASMFLFVGAYQIGFGPLTWLVLSEIFPLRVRSAALSLGTLTNFASNLLVTLSFESERLLLGESLLFLQFAVVAALAVAFTFAFVFETRGLSLEQIERKLRDEVDK